MGDKQELTQNILMYQHNVHGKTWGRTVRIHKKTVFWARKRMVEHTRQCTRQRFLPFLPLKHTETRESLMIPNQITREDQLWAYVAKEKPFWLDHHHR